MGPAASVIDRHGTIGGFREYSLCKVMERVRWQRSDD